MTISSRHRREGIRRRVQSAEPTFAACVVLDCGQPTMARARSGLNRAYCKRHVEHYRRHGSYTKSSYTAAELKGYRHTALSWLQGHSELPEVRSGVERIGVLYRRAGRPVGAFRLTGMPPEARAGDLWARLAARDISPLAVLSVWLAVCLCHHADPQPERKIEFRWVQAAKLLHRMAGGSHKRWEREAADGSVQVTELHKYPASRGRVLRHIGEALAAAGEPLKIHLATLEARHVAVSSAI